MCYSIKTQIFSPTKHTLIVPAGIDLFCISINHSCTCHCFFSRIRAQRIIVLRRSRNWFGYNPNGTNSRWTQAGKPAEHNSKDKLPRELLTSRTT